MKKQTKVSIELWMHKWPVFAVGFAHGEFFMSLWIVDLRVWRGY